MHECIAVGLYCNSDKRKKAIKIHPIIGITTAGNTTGDYFLRRQYCSAVLGAGGIPIMLPPVGRPRAAIGICDGILLSGGGDIAPRLCGITDYDPARLVDPFPERDEYELELALLAHTNDIPLLGICRGMQIMNTALGGSLIFDINTHMQHLSREQPYHEIKITSGSRLHKLVLQDTLATNSFHHQAIDRPASTLSVSALAEDGVTEALEDASKQFYLGVQWHPEHMDTHASAVLFAGLCAEADRRS